MRQTHHLRGFLAGKVSPEPNDTETIRQIATEACKNQRPARGGKGKGLAPRKEMTATYTQPWMKELQEKNRDDYKGGAGTSGATCPWTEELRQLPGLPVCDNLPVVTQKALAPGSRLFRADVAEQNKRGRWQSVNPGRSSCSLRRSCFSA